MRRKISDTTLCSGIRYEVKVNGRSKGLCTFLRGVDFPWLEVPQLAPGSYKFYFTLEGEAMLLGDWDRLNPYLEGLEVVRKEARIREETIAYQDFYQVAIRRSV